MTVSELDERMSYGEWLHWVALAKIDKDAADGAERQQDATDAAKAAIRAGKGR